jgi:thiol:disulfide interchange protein DsbA
MIIIKGETSLKKVITFTLIALLSACVNKQVQKAPEKPPEKPIEVAVVQPVETKTIFREGSHYKLINANAPVHKAGDKIKITEYFLYACPHCYELEPKLTKWLEKHVDEVEFNRIPAILGPTWGEMAKFYYVAEKLGILEEMHQAFFDEIHTSDKKYYSELAVRNFFLKNGITLKQYNDAYFSEEVRTKVNEARLQAVQLNLRGVPAVTVNDKWLTAPYYVRNQEQMLELLDYLVKLESRGGQEE